MKKYIEDYLERQKKAIKSIPVKEVEKLITLFDNALKEDRQIFVFGNGGSGANASHFVTDLGKIASDKTYRRFRCISLNENMSWITAIGNDYAYEDIFYRQLENYARPGDIVMMLSVSGSSPNLIKAMEWCRLNQVASIALTGGKKGKLFQLADHSIAIGDTHYGIVEDCQMHICHMICYAFVESEVIMQEEE